MNNNSKMEYNYGPMGCGKTRELLKVYYSKKEDGFEVIILKPSKDKKGDNFIVSRDNGKIRVDFLIGEEDNIYQIIAMYLTEHNLDVILVDEAQFLSATHIEQLSDVVDIMGINVICYGLLTDFQTKMFEGSKRLIELSEVTHEIERQCSCGHKKAFNARFINGEFVLEGDQVAIDGIDAEYRSVCRRCYKKYKRMGPKNRKN